MCQAADRLWRASCFFGRLTLSSSRKAPVLPARPLSRCHRTGGRAAPDASPCPRPVPLRPRQPSGHLGVSGGLSECCFVSTGHTEMVRGTWPWRTHSHLGERPQLGAHCAPRAKLKDPQGRTPRNRRGPRRRAGGTPRNHWHRPTMPGQWATSWPLCNVSCSAGLLSSVLLSFLQFPLVFLDSALNAALNCPSPAPRWPWAFPTVVLDGPSPLLRSHCLGHFNTASVFSSLTEFLPDPTFLFSVPSLEVATRTVISSCQRRMPDFSFLLHC